MPVNEYKDARQCSHAEDHTTLEVLKAEFVAYQKMVDDHLKILNGETGRIAAAAEIYLRKDVFDERHRATEITIKELTSRTAVLELWKSSVGGKATVIVAAAAIVGALIGAILEHVFR